MRFCLSSLLLLWSAVAFAGEPEFTAWRKYSTGALIAETTGLAPGQPGTLGLHVTLAPGWHTYWVNPGDSGSALRLQFKVPEGLKIRAVHHPFPQRFTTGPLISFGYAKEVLFLIDVEVAPDVRAGRQLDLAVDAEWLVCEDVCIPAVDTLRLSVPVLPLQDVKPGERFALFQKTRAQVPRRAPNAATWQVEDLVSMIDLGDALKGREYVDFFVFRGAGVTNAKPFVRTAQSLKLEVAKNGQPPKGAERIGVLVTKASGSDVLEATQFGDSGWTFEVTTAEAAGTAAGSLWWMLVSAFLGGLILNLMPCVFPILSMKLLSVLKLGAAHPREVRQQNLAYVAGVLVSFLTIALMLSALRSAGTLVGWGFQLQSPVFLSLLTWLFFALSLNLLGVYEIDLFNAGFGHRLTRFGGMWGSFFTGVLAVIVASPCTAPFMGVALGFGLAQPTSILIAVFLSLGLGLAFPYLLFVFFPSFVSVLPKPGLWMMRLKQIMAFPLLLTSLWLVWVLGQVSGPNSVAMVLGVCVALGFAFWLAGWHKRLAQAVAALALLIGVYVVYAADGSKDAAAVPAAEDGDWKAFQPALLDELKGQNVFVNMTADWCLTCKVNERLVFADAEILALLKARQVTLVKGDWTQRNADITSFLNRFQRAGVPFYVMYSARHPEGLVLPEVLTKTSFKEWIDKAFPQAGGSQ